MLNDKENYLFREVSTILDVLIRQKCTSILDVYFLDKNEPFLALHKCCQSDLWLKPKLFMKDLHQKCFVLKLLGILSSENKG